ncbi:hypothetical protein HMPREF1092_03305 [Clostridium thermobutyricum]|uniref:Uncharacterized protein n=1 Tax=Clostridium thermobutyricum TaxID=29372 RepID=N9XGE3_9CLOT|nr:hypothetical protein [Clostridium thermobutyricum]ENY98747.1 hypothetical protein HMPREF1092_03305 [Clostridium thermobutyricum]
MHSKNFIFWKTAFERNQVDIYTLAQMTGINGELTSDEFQEITGMNYIPDVAGNKVNFVSTSDIMQQLAMSKIANMQKDKMISDLASQIALNKINSMQKDMIINNLSKQVANNKLELIELKNKEM